MTTKIKRLAIALCVSSLGACTFTPLDLVAPAGIALMHGADMLDKGEPITVEAMLQRARGEPTVAPVPEAAAGKISVEQMLANARAADTGEAPETASTSPDGSAAISVETLKQQIMETAPGDPDAKECR